jgi:hypothetical protein
MGPRKYLKILSILAPQRPVFEGSILSPVLQKIYKCKKGKGALTFPFLSGQSGLEGDKRMPHWIVPLVRLGDAVEGTYSLGLPWV